MTGDEIAAEIAECQSLGINEHIITDVVQVTRHHARGSLRSIAADLHLRYGGLGSSYGPVWRPSLQERVAALGPPPAPPTQYGQQVPGQNYVEAGPGLGRIYTDGEIDTPRSRFFAGLRASYENRGGQA